MPWKSKKQEAWGNSPAGHEAMGKDKVNEFNAASKGMKLPERIGKNGAGVLSASKPKGIDRLKSAYKKMK